MLRSVILGCGSALPARVLSNAELAATVETSDEWIVQRTGIHQRYIAAWIARSEVNSPSAAI